MNEERQSAGREASRSRPVVVCICGMLASGKSTLARALADHWRPAPVLAFDDYEQYTQWPSDMPKWIQDGADPSSVTNRRLRDDLQALVEGRPAQHPLTRGNFMPSSLVLLEDPFGRTRPDILDLIDYVLFVDLPTDLSVVRLVRRVLLPLSAGSVGSDAERIAATQRWLDHYVAHRAMYTSPQLLGPVRNSADAILDGEKSREEVLADAISRISQQLGS